MASSNPYKPGAGRRPPLLAGRESLIEDISSEMAMVEEDGVGDQPCVVWGLRGMGKTALLKVFADDARNRGWMVISLEAAPSESLATRISQAASLELRRLRGNGAVTSSSLKHAISVLKSFQLKFDPTGAISFGVDIDPARGFADTGNLSVDLQELFRALGSSAADDGVAVLVEIDELQEASEEDLGALNRALHAIGQDLDPVPLVFIGAGLPALPAVLAKATSYAERLYRYYAIEFLDDEEAARALSEPALRAEVRWEEDAIAEAVAAAGGYPYFVQQYGRSIWDQRLDASRISLDDCKAGILVARDEIDRGLYRSRWERATEADREFMRAMARDEGPSALADLVERLGKHGQNELSVVRRRLIDAGQVYVPVRGEIAFAIPGMGDYINRVSDDQRC